MKTAITRIASFVLVCFLFFGATAYKPAATNRVTGDIYHGYWIAKSGEEFMIMNEAIIPEAGYVLDAKGEMKSIDKEGVKTTLHFVEKYNVDGKQVDAHFFAFTKVELDRSIRSVTPTAKNVTPALSIKDIAAAYLFCTGGTAAGWGGTTSFSSSSGLGTATKFSSGESISIYCITR